MVMSDSGSKVRTEVLQGSSIIRTVKVNAGLGEVCNGVAFAESVSVTYYPSSPVLVV